ncbi:MAG: hypothetical protein E6G95_19935 [Alphaproteobacteria bacterium]|nr:MAG: hypothetical protein E6G95_19935 [Alphaproteobacteria bacterium]
MRIAFLALAALLAVSTGAAAQTPTKTIGTPQQPQIVPSLIVLNAKAAKLACGKLTLEGVSPNAIVFADRPIRAAGHALTAHLLEEWSAATPDGFAKDPPNATVSVFDKAKGNVADAVVVLKAPKLEGDRLVFEAALIEGDLGQADGPATLFIDIVNLPMVRRTAHRAAWYAGAKQP